MNRANYLETEEQKLMRMNSSCLVFHGDSKCPRCIQPERSKREDECEEFDHLWTWFPNDKSYCLRCGALNSMET